MATLIYRFTIIHVLPTLGIVLGILLAVQLIRNPRPSGHTLAWLLGIVLLPYISIPLFIIFGGRKLQRIARRKKTFHQSKADKDAIASAKGLDFCGKFPVYYNNQIEVLSTGEISFRRMISLIESAKERVYLSTFILKRDATGIAIRDALAKRAEDGVKVRVLLDGLGSFWIFHTFMSPLVQAGGRYHFFMPMLRLPFGGRANLRNHRKTVLIDSNVAIVGGMNIANEYMGPTRDSKRWKDLSFEIRGPAVKEIEEIFRADWKFAAEEDLPSTGKSTASSNTEGIPIQVIPTGPDIEGDPLHDSLLTVIFGAKKSIWIITPFFIPDDTLINALAIAARRGIEINIIVPEKTDVPIADLANGAYLRQIGKSSVNIFRYAPKMLHAKVVIVDDELAVIGSANVDMRSLFLNYETAFFVYSKECVETLLAWSRSLSIESKRGAPRRGYLGETVDGIGRLLAPLM